MLEDSALTRIDQAGSSTRALSADEVDAFLIEIARISPRSSHESVPRSEPAQRILSTPPPRNISDSSGPGSDNLRWDGCRNALGQTLGLDLSL